MIRYSDASGEELRLGDVVRYRSQLLFWKWKPGRVTYVPGVSPKHPEMEHSGLSWVGVAGEDGTYRGVLVDPVTLLLQRSVRFCTRGSVAGFLTPEQIPEAEW